MKKSILPFAVLAAMLFSCSNDDDVNPIEETPECQVTTVILNGETTTFTYGADGKINTYNVVDGSYTAQGTIKYNNGSIVASETYAEPGFNGEFTQTYTLNSSNQIVSSSDGETYEYSADGYLSKIYFKNGNGYYVFTYENGNLIKEESVVNDDPINYTTDFKYSNEGYSQFTAASIKGYNNEALLEHHKIILKEQGYFGKLSKNRIQSIDGFPVTYSTDSEGKVTSLEYSYQSDKNNASFKYNCN